MKLGINESAMNWFKKEMGIQSGDFVRFYARYGGFSTQHPSFSLGVSKELPNQMGTHTVMDGVTFYVEHDDMWYLDNVDLMVDYNKEKDELLFDYKSVGGVACST